MVPGGGTAGRVLKPSIIVDTEMTGAAGPSLPWGVLSDMSTQISPTRLNGGRFPLNS
jgi:hypothetical protein